MTDQQTPAVDDNELDDHLLDRYWLGETSPQETAAVNRWFAAHPGQARWYAELRGAIVDDHWVDLTPDEVSSTITAAMRSVNLAVPDIRAWNGIRERASVYPQRPVEPTVGISGNTNNVTAMKRVPPRRFARVSSVLAAGLAAAVALFTTWQFGAHGVMSDMAAQSSVYTTQNGERARVTLPDGSVVDLNVASRLEVPSNYAAGNRTVRLEGEAFFTVTHHSNAPFTVVSGPSTTRVLGTRFVVRHYATDSVATVAVRDGRVAVASIILDAAQSIVVGRHWMSEMHPAEEKQFAFTNGILNIDDMSLADAAILLGRWYDVDIRFGNPSLRQLRTEGTLAAGSITDVIALLELTFNLQVVRDGRTLTLYPRV